MLQVGECEACNAQVSADSVAVDAEVVRNDVEADSGREAAYARVRSTVRRMNWILPVGPRQFAMRDWRQEPRVRELLMMDLDSETLTRYPEKLGQLDLASGKDSNLFDLIVGTWKEGLIGYLPSQEAVEGFRPFRSDTSCKGAWQCVFLLRFNR